MVTPRRAVKYATRAAPLHRQTLHYVAGGTFLNVGAPIEVEAAAPVGSLAHGAVWR